MGVAPLWLEAILPPESAAVPSWGLPTQVMPLLAVSWVEEGEEESETWSKTESCSSKQQAATMIMNNERITLLGSCAPNAIGRARTAKLPYASCPCKQVADGTEHPINKRFRLTMMCREMVASSRCTELKDPSVERTTTQEHACYTASPYCTEISTEASANCAKSISACNMTL